MAWQHPGLLGSAVLSAYLIAPDRLVGITNLSQTTYAKGVDNYLQRRSANIPAGVRAARARIHSYINISTRRPMFRSQDLLPLQNSPTNSGYRPCLEWPTSRNIYYTSALASIREVL